MSHFVSTLPLKLSTLSCSGGCQVEGRSVFGVVSYTPACHTTPVHTLNPLTLSSVHTLCHHRSWLLMTWALTHAGDNLTSGPQSEKHIRGEGGHPSRRGGGGSCVYENGWQLTDDQQWKVIQRHISRLIHLCNISSLSCLLHPSAGHIAFISAYLPFLRWTV